jgi:integrase
MAKSGFTPTEIAAIACAPGQQQLLRHDPKTPGLAVRVTAAGHRAYIFEARLFGKTLRMTIGDTRTWSLPDAQRQARHLKSLVDQGIDPREQRAQRRLDAAAAVAKAAQQELTLGMVWPVYLDVRRPYWSPRHYADHTRLANPGGTAKSRGNGVRTAAPLAALMTVRLSELTATRISSWLSAEATRRPTSAAQAFRLLRAFLNWAASAPDYQTMIATNTHSARSVRDVLPKSRSKDGDCLQREQLTAWFSAVQQLSNPVIRIYLQALLLTGARREEMANLRWEDVDFQWRSLTLRDKVEGQRVIPLPPYLAGLLLDLKRLHAASVSVPMGESRARREVHENKWVFWSVAAADGRLQEPRIAHNKALAAAGLPHLTLHGLRRSFGTLCEWVEMPTGIAAQIMGHKPSALAEQHYRRRPLDLLRLWHDKIEVWILEQAGIRLEPAPPLRLVEGS